MPPPNLFLKRILIRVKIETHNNTYIENQNPNFQNSSSKPLEMRGVQSLASRVTHPQNLSKKLTAIGGFIGSMCQQSQPDKQCIHTAVTVLFYALIVNLGFFKCSTMLPTAALQIVQRSDLASLERSHLRQVGTF